MGKELDTSIRGVCDKDVIDQAVKTYADGLRSFAFPKDQQTDLSVLEAGFTRNLERVMPFVASIIQEINQRQEVLESGPYKALEKRDEALWKHNDEEDVSGGALACVDKGIPSEAFSLTKASLGRTFAGDLPISYSQSAQSFVMIESPITKRLVHEKRLGRKQPEKLWVHTRCGRLMQMMKNHKGHPDIPTTNSVINHLDALKKEFVHASDDEKEDGIHIIKTVWSSLERDGISVFAPDNGIWVGILRKIAQRQAAQRLLQSSFCPSIELYDKLNGDLIAGLDKLDVLTDPVVVQEKGFTEKALASLLEDGKIFSFIAHIDAVAPLLFSRTDIAKGAKTYEDIQTEWLEAQTDLVTLTEALWHLYEENDPHVTRMVESYFEHAFALMPEEQKPQGDTERWFIHQLFHTFSYAYLLNTLELGNPPGVEHIEKFLAIGPDMGTKKYLALGQGDLDKPSASEIFTGYSVLLHGGPGKTHEPVVVMIKLDTYKSDDKDPISGEETTMALNNLRKFLSLWPYFLVGDMIPALTIRQRQQHQGVSRVALSVVLAFTNMSTLIDREDYPLPPYVYALNSKGEVVYIPAQTVIDVGKSTDCNLKEFREKLPQEADRFSLPEIQKSFIDSMQQYQQRASE